MNSKKIYLGLYYFSLILSIFVCVIPRILQTNIINPSSSIDIYVNLSEISIYLMVINVWMVVYFSILLSKRKLNNVNILFPISYILFTVIILIVCLLFNNKVLIPYLQFSYYINFILINYILLNIYSVLSFSKNNKK